MPLFFKWEALRTKVAPLLTATLASLSLPDFAWFLPLEGSPWCLSRAGLRLLLSLLSASENVPQKATSMT